MAAALLTPAPDVLALQHAVAGRYALERELGRGGMGVVLLARDLALDRQVALKLLPPALAADPALRMRFLREARISAGLSHPHVVPIHAVEEHEAPDGDVVFFAMAFVDGETLAERVRRAGPLSPGEAARVLREVAWALAYAHGRGVVHRDVKPDNVMIERGSGRALVSDFGIAQSAAAPSTLTRDGQILGTVAFMSPEQAAGESVDGRSDLYALGGVGFYALTGRPPFEAPSAAALLVQRITVDAPPVASVRTGLPPRLALAVDRCLARTPGGRFASAEAVAEALAEAAPGAAARDIAPPVRSFMRAAEQTLQLAALILFFTLLYGLPTTRNVGWLVFTVVFGTAVVSADLVRRARELLGEGFGAADVRRAFTLEAQAHEEELRALFDARRTAARRRTRRRAWAVVGAAVALKILTLVQFARMTPGTRAPLTVTATVLADIVTAVSLTLALNASPRAERRYFRVTARMWRSRFGPAFFRLAGIGRAHEDGAREAAAAAPNEAVPPAVAARFPELPALLRRLGDAQAALGAREADIARAVAAAGVPAAGVGGTADASTDGDASATTALMERRDALLGDMRAALEAARARRTALAAARENVRVQLLRIGAGVGAPDDLAGELAAARGLVDAA